ncbi:hypothetical protein DPMN_069229 [Dreissena polymorpha]|uniref:Uncharacterized protein n=1 Tax=Dreissena polymorpha TaxID=45954 RepID=A0A9D3Z339_DREPO|nr:hypothetical protein DPMN_069229 [Dreissena polymorpha]
MMLRNHSDLSSRIRKRVTYRLNSAPLPKLVANEQAESKLSCERGCSTDVSNEDIAEEVTNDPMGELVNETGRCMFDLHVENANNTSNDEEVFHDSHTILNHVHTSANVQNVCSQTAVTTAVSGIDHIKTECKIDIDHEGDMKNEKYGLTPAFPILNEPSDHRVLVPLGSVNALVSDVTDV